jgi:hypothetical protein
MPEREGIEVLSRIRAGKEVDEILRELKQGSLLAQLSVVPETRRRYELPYLPRMPDFVITPNNPYLGSLVYDAIFDPASPPLLLEAGKASDAPYLTPYHASELIEPLLPKVTASSWTYVTTDDQLLRKLLGAYLLQQHPVFPAFHKDLFLEDMVTGHHGRFCSRLLVNSVLAISCVSFISQR